VVITFRTFLETKTFQVRQNCWKLRTEQLVAPVVMKKVPENTCFFSRDFFGWCGMGAAGGLLVPLYAITGWTV
jgi:hypothetical protein